MSRERSFGRTERLGATVAEHTEAIARQREENAELRRELQAARLEIVVLKQWMDGQDKYAAGLERWLQGLIAGLGVFLMLASVLIVVLAVVVP